MQLMFKNLLKNYRRFKRLPSILSEINKNIQSNKSKLHEIHATEILNSLSSNNARYDALTTFSMLPTTIVHILNDILINDRKMIIEFGTGNSTIFLARLIHNLGLGIQFYSIDQDQDWQDKIKRSLKMEGIEEAVTFVYAPLRSCEFQFKTQQNWYDTDILKRAIDGKLFDLVIVDGPVASVIEHARYPALPFLMNNLSSNKAIFLDDSNRIGEKEILAEWTKMIGTEFQYTGRYSFLNDGSNLITKPIFLKED
jgi:hypothetical protein